MERDAKMVASQKELVLNAINNLRQATEIAGRLKSSSNPEVAELAKAVHFASYGAQEIGLALTDQGRQKDLNI